MNDTIEKISGGAIIFARQTIESDIFASKPDSWFKIWFYIISKANHKNNGKFNRGQCFLKYEWIEEATHATRNQVKHCIEYLKKALMIATQKSTRGMIITVIKYDYFQSLENYEHAKSHTERNTEATRKPHESHTINKNDKNDKNDKKGESTPSQEAISFFQGEEPYGELLTLFSKDREPKLIEQEFKKFVLYWTEKNKTGTKERWQQQDTFEVKRRLLTWLSRVDKFSDKQRESKLVLFS